MTCSVTVCLQAFSGRTRNSASSWPTTTTTAATTPRRPAPSFWLSCRSTRDAEESPSPSHCTCTRCTQDRHYLTTGLVLQTAIAGVGVQPCLTCLVSPGPPKEHVSVSEGAERAASSVLQPSLLLAPGGRPPQLPASRLLHHHPLHR